MGCPSQDMLGGGLARAWEKDCLSRALLSLVSLPGFSHRAAGRLRVVQWYAIVNIIMWG